MKMNWLLLCVLVIIGLCIFHGYQSGIVKMLFSVATFIITVILVRMLAPVGVQMIKSNDAIYNSIKAPVENMLEEQINGEIKTEEVLDSCQVSEDVKANILSVADKAGISEIQIFTPELKNITAECITLKIIDLLAYVLIFIIINVGLRILAIVLDFFSKLPGINGVNKLSGAALGAVEGLAVIWIIFLVITVFSASDWGRSCFDMIGDSTILSVLYAKNLFLVFV